MILQQGLQRLIGLGLITYVKGNLRARTSRFRNLSCHLFRALMITTIVEPNIKSLIGQLYRYACPNTFAGPCYEGNSSIPHERSLVRILPYRTL